jgi:glycerol kinase
MQKDLGSSLKLKKLNVDGGASMNALLMQFQSDLLGVKLIRPKNIETTSLGAALVSGLGAQIWPNLSQLKKLWKTSQSFTPRLSSTDRAHRISHWNAEVRKS